MNEEYQKSIEEEITLIKRENLKLKNDMEEIIITNEDPYDEDPRKIMDDVAMGVKLAKKNPKMIENRRDAIRAGLRACSAGDILVITGKGSEQVMVVRNGEKIPWDDRKVVKEELKLICKE
jgi:UDP-N-acetylmuramoyl-L-alanyl-D-glutamate--2,6-diaminopimelate ligase